MTAAPGKTAPATAPSFPGGSGPAKAGGSAPSFGRSARLLLGIPLLSAGLIGALLQPVVNDPLSSRTFWDGLLSPMEINPSQRLPTIAGGLNAIHVSIDGKRIWLAGNRSTILHSDDAGLSWTKQYPPEEEPAAGVPAAAGLDWLVGSAWAADAPEQKIFTELEQGLPPGFLDKGADSKEPVAEQRPNPKLTRPQQQGQAAPLTAVEQDKIPSRIIVGPDAQGLIDTPPPVEDADPKVDAATEEPVQTGAPNLRAIAFKNNQEGWAVGDTGTLLYTINGGQLWQPQLVPTKANFYTLHVGPAGVWVGGADDQILVLSPVLNSWVKTTIAATRRVRGTVTEIAFSDSKNGVAVRLDGMVFVTDDAGFLWRTGQRLEVEPNILTALPRGAGFVLGGGKGALLRTSDGSEPWQEVYPSQRFPIVALNFDDNGQGIVLAADGTVLQSSDSGLNWRATPTAAKLTLRAAQILADGSIWAVAEDGLLWHSENNGAAWQQRSKQYVGKGAYWRLPPGWSFIALAASLALLWPVVIGRYQSAPAQESIADLLSSDRPLSSGDPDALNLGRIAAGLSRFIRNTRTEPPLTIAVTGEWGSGKSSLMNLLYEDLQRRSFRPVWFNAWHHQKGENLLASLVANIRAQGVPRLLARGGPTFLYRLFQRRGWRHWVKTFVLGMVLVASVRYLWLLDDPVQFLSDAVKGLSDPEKDSIGLGIVPTTLIPVVVLWRALTAFGVNPRALMNSVSDNMRGQRAIAQPGARYQFASEFKDVTEALGERKMVIFIDDLDRCQPSHVVEVLEAVNFLMTSGRCIAVLGMDVDYVETCVGLEFEELAEATQENDHAESLQNGEAQTPASAPHPSTFDRIKFARRYMEKLVNIPVIIPAPDASSAKHILRPEPPVPPGRLAQMAGWAQQRLPQFASVVLLLLLIWLGMWLADQVPKDKNDRPVTQKSPVSEQVPTPDSPDAEHPKKGEANVKPVVKKVPDVVFENARSGSRLGELELPLLVAVLLIAGFAWSRLRAPQVTSTDSPAFERAIELWQPCIVEGRHTPRLLKRFLNEVRYLAMTQRPLATDSTPWQRLLTWLGNLYGRKRSPEEHESSAAIDGLHEAKIVGLAAIENVESDWISEAKLFRRLTQGQYVPESFEQRGRLVEIFESVAADQQIASHWPLTEDDRQRYIQAKSGIFFDK